MVFQQCLKFICPLLQKMPEQVEDGIGGGFSCLYQQEGDFITQGQSYDGLQASVGAHSATVLPMSKAQPRGFTDNGPELVGTQAGQLSFKS